VFQSRFMVDSKLFLNTLSIESDTIDPESDHWA
jgi:hypothetical protein